ncbi:MAG: D-sedoheptulose 7-phosphate isomerase [Endomicrobiales bacterium]|nr:D-sedoheptulose 7-phosphate isomerase [Endomicrobiales bacterium]
MKDRISELIKGSIDAKQKLLLPEQLTVIEGVAASVIEACKGGRKVLLCGNGGSAADSQHFAAELVSRFEKERKALAAVALTTDTSIITAIANDYAYDRVFARQVEALGQKGDVFIAISTSGGSAAVIKAAEQAKAAGIRVIGFTGEKGARLREKCDICFIAPSAVTARIQECHGLVIHIICSLVEEKLFGK